MDLIDTWFEHAFAPTFTALAHKASGDLTRGYEK
jgi:hypothetical protein